MRHTPTSAVCARAHSTLLPIWNKWVSTLLAVTSHCGVSYRAPIHMEYVTVRGDSLGMIENIVTL